MFEANKQYFFFSDFRWLKFWNWYVTKKWLFLKPLTDFTKLETNLDPVLKLFHYLQWVKKRLIQDCVKFEQVLPQIEDFFVNCKHYWLFVNEYYLYVFICTRYYFIPQICRCWERICLKRKEQPHSYVI